MSLWPQFGAKEPNLIKAAQEAYRDAGLLRRHGKPIGASRREIRQFEQEFSIELPLAYRQYARWMGRHYDGIFRGSEGFFLDIADNNEMLELMLEENNRSHPRQGAPICFMTHQGYVANWFYVDDGVDDPICYRMMDDGELTETERFSDYLLGEVSGIGKLKV